MNDEIMQNANLDGATFTLDGQKDICVILVHGFTATTVEVRPLAEYLNQRGFSVVAPLLPGHGTNPDDLNQTTWKEWVDKVEIVHRRCATDYKNVFIGGESMGGVLSLYVAAMNPEITGILLFAPAIMVEKLSFSRYMRFFRKEVKKTNSEENHKSDLFPWQGYKVNPTKAAYQLYLLQQATKKKLKEINQPTIIFQGKYDKTISMEGPILIYNQIQSDKKELILLENSEHCVLLERDFQLLSRKAEEFITDNINF